jgi:type IV secretory pathway component VirB8
MVQKVDGSVSVGSVNRQIGLVRLLSSVYNALNYHNPFSIYNAMNYQNPVGQRSRCIVNAKIGRSAPSVGAVGAL